jgi:hypothetical protein
MRRFERLRAVVLIAFGIPLGMTFAACDQGTPLDTGPQRIVLAGKPAPIDVSGTWNWSEEAKGLIPAESADFFGIVPEGKATHFTCHDSGTLIFIQTGQTFEGTGTQVGECFTRGGQFISNDFTFSILNGQIHGHSISFDFDDPICPYKAVLTVENGVAIAMHGTGFCGPFGPRDLFKSILFEGTR